MGAFGESTGDVGTGVVLVIVLSIAVVLILIVVEELTDFGDVVLCDFI